MEENKKINFSPGVKEKKNPEKRSFFGGAGKVEKKQPKFKKEKGPKDEDPDKRIKISRLRKESFHRPLRVILWALLIFVAVRGAVSMAKPDQVSAMMKKTDAFMKNFQGTQTLQMEVGAYAQTFAKEYLTYSPGQELEYTKRLQLYAPKVFSSTADQLKTLCASNYAAAYKIELYAPDQYDVYVMAKAVYQLPQTSPDGKEVTMISTVKDVYMKVPVRWSVSGCVVTDFPAFIAGPDPIDYPSRDFNGDLASNDQKVEIEKAMNDFFGVYYGDTQSRVNYYLLTPDLGDRIKAMDGRYTFNKIDVLNAYEDPQAEGDFVAITTIKVTDLNGTGFDQRYSIYLTHKDGRYYIKSLDNRAVDLKIMKNEKETTK